MSINLPNLLVFANLLLVVGGIIGGYFTLRSSLSRGAAEIQAKVRTALKDENELLQTRLDRVEEDNILLKHQIQLVIEILKRQGIILEIDGEMVQLRDAKGSTFRTTRPVTPSKKRSISKSEESTS